MVALIVRHVGAFGTYCFHYPLATVYAASRNLKAWMVFPSQIIPLILDGEV